MPPGNSGRQSTESWGGGATVVVALAPKAPAAHMKVRFQVTGVLCGCAPYGGGGQRNSSTIYNSYDFVGSCVQANLKSSTRSFRNLNFQTLKTEVGRTIARGACCKPVLWTNQEACMGTDARKSRASCRRGGVLASRTEYSTMSRQKKQRRSGVWPSLHSLVLTEPKTPSNKRCVHFIPHDMSLVEAC